MPSSTISLTLRGRELSLYVGEDAFIPTTTTQRIAEAIDLPPNADVLDLGCGVGPLAIWCALEGAARVHAVDVVEAAAQYARENAELNGVADKVQVHHGDLFEPVHDKKFDIIVNDVSGIADRVARLSSWYPDPIPTGGNDGTDVVTRMLSESPDHLKPGGSIYFATATLSNVTKIIDHARKIYGDRLEKVSSSRFPFSAELNEHREELEQLREQGLIEFETRRSRMLWTLDVWHAKVD